MTARVGEHAQQQMHQNALRQFPFTGECRGIKGCELHDCTNWAGLTHSVRSRYENVSGLRHFSTPDNTSVQMVLWIVRRRISGSDSRSISHTGSLSSQGRGGAPAFHSTSRLGPSLQGLTLFWTPVWTAVWRTTIVSPYRCPNSCFVSSATTLTAVCALAVAAG